MTHIILSKNISFCFGVQRTIALVNKLLKEKKYKKIYMLGEIVHNEFVINDLLNRGLKLIKNFNKIPDIKDGILVIQSHGVPPWVYEVLDKKKIKYIDSTCLLVKRIHKAVKQLEKQGFFPVIVGNKNHTEVKGISGYVKQKIIIGDPTEIKKELFQNIEKIGIVFQSTFIKEKGERIVKEIKKYVKNIRVIDTICNPTKERQFEIKKNAKKFDCVLVIGSKTSANTNHLFNIAFKENKNTFFVESPEDVNKIDMKKFNTCFISSGASTPEYLIREVFKIANEKMNKFLQFSSKYIPLIDEDIKFYFKEKKNNNNNVYREKEFLNILEEFCLRPGKRLRPLLLLLGYTGFRKKQGKIEKKIVKIAASIELMHSFLLIHDDIMDNSDLRRGGLSLHKMFEKRYSSYTYNKEIGKEIALVVGDILFANVIEFIAKIPLDKDIKNRFLSYFGRCYALTGYGQILDSLATQPKEMPLDENILISISKYKTAYYTIFYPLSMGYILGGGKNNNIIFQLEKFAIPLGIGFQIRDDILSIFGDKLKTGKSDVSDIRDSKYTLLIHKTYSLLKGRVKKEFLNLFNTKKKTEKEIYRIKKIIEESGALKESITEMKKMFKKSLQILDNLNMNKEEKEILKDLINYLELNLGFMN